MALIYRRINLTSGGGSDTKDIKISLDDTTAGFIEDKLVVGSTKLTKQTLNPGADELLELDVDETQIDHNNLTNYDVNQHRDLDDLSTTNTTLWSSTKIQSELDEKINKATPVVDNTLLKTVGTSGVDVEATGIQVDDSDNVTGINDLTIDGDLTVNGTTTSVNSSTLEVTDANITVNNGGTQASADTQNAGITVEMSDATDVTIGYDSTTSSKFSIGEVGDLREVVTTSHSQTLLNKTVNADNNTVSNLEVDNLKSGVLATDLDLAVDNTNIPAAQAVKDYVIARVAEKDDADEISYDNTASGLAATEVQSAIDEVEGRVDVVETDLSNHLNGDPSKHNATQINYSGTESGLEAGNVQTAIDEVEARVDTVEDTANNATTAINDHINNTTDTHDASAISFVPTGGISADEVQAAIVELDVEKYNAIDFDSDFDTRLATKTTDDVTEGTNLYFTNARARVIDEDLNEGSFTLAESQIGATITGFNFANATVRSFKAIVSVFIDADSDVFEEFELAGIQKGASWDVSVSSTGDDTDITFDVDNSGQLVYNSSTYTGFVTGTLKYRAKVTTV